MSVLPTEPCPLSPEQSDIVELTRAFARDEIRPRARAVDEADTATPWDLWRAAAEVGITGFMLPIEPWMRDAKLEETEEGTSDIMRLIISRGL
ncbi:acyl-CoA dehydrogenase family protein [Streptomyces sp. 8N616]|uniref:acyl-CoA dehydrogenase family protein n=1 Tax=Streptomyces sp. 8N616 TaxID=3457414 RepID=UPI003FD03888